MSIAITAEPSSIIGPILSQASPGEVNEVMNDLFTLLGNGANIKTLVQEHLKNYNQENLVEYKIAEDPKSKAIFSSSAETKDGCIYDPRTEQTYSPDHENLLLSNPKKHKSQADDTQLKALISGVENYITDNFPNGFGSVFPIDSGSFEIVIVASKYDPSNFCNARWCSRWTWSPLASKIVGNVSGIVHFFEDGNVQLSLKKSFEEEISPNAQVPIIFKAIQKAETEYQIYINKLYQDMDQNSLRNLRRALPVTKTKIDWHKIANYKIGSELTNK